jgi:hypothetical protein
VIDGVCEMKIHVLVDEIGDASTVHHFIPVYHSCSGASEIDRPNVVPIQSE